MDKLIFQNTTFKEVVPLLPSDLRNTFLLLPGYKKREFVNRYHQSKISLSIGYLMLLFIFPFHYAYQGKWGKQLAFWLTGGGLLVWWFFDFFRLPGMVRDYNAEVGARVLKVVEEEV